jgi:hypothetical protein
MAAPSIAILARLTTGVPVDQAVVARLPPDDPLRDIVRRVLDANGRAREVFEAAIAARPDREEIERLVFEAGVEEPLPDDSNVPALPEDVRPDLALAGHTGVWLDAYVRYAQSVAPMTPKSFHESAALWLAATAIARRLRLPMAFGDVFPNLYILWLAATTVFQKSTALDIPKRIAREAFPHLLGADDMTPEALLSDMAGREPAKFDLLDEAAQQRWREERDFAAQRSLVIDEISGLMASAGRDYNAGLLEWFLKFYDNEPYVRRTTRALGRIDIRNSCLSILGASTPSMMAPHLGTSLLWANGWWPRFAILTPEIAIPEYAVPTAIGGPGDDILLPLARLYESLPKPSWPEAATPLDVRLGRGVHERWEAYNKALRYTLQRDLADEHLRGTYGRLPVTALKVSTQLAAIDWAIRQDDPSPRIELPHLHRAIAIVEGWRASAHRAIEQAAECDENVRLRRLLVTIGKSGAQGITARDLTRAMRDVPPKEIGVLIRFAAESGFIHEAEPEPSVTSKRGRPTVRYVLSL